MHLSYLYGPLGAGEGAHITLQLAFQICFSVTDRGLNLVVPIDVGDTGPSTPRFIFKIFHRLNWEHDKEVGPLLSSRESKGLSARLPEHKTARAQGCPSTRLPKWYEAHFRVPKISNLHWEHQRAHFTFSARSSAERTCLGIL